MSPVMGMAMEARCASVLGDSLQCAFFSCTSRGEASSGGRVGMWGGASWAGKLVHGVGSEELLGFEGREGSRSITALASASPAVASQAGRAVPLPIDYYQVLRADTHFLADAIVRAYEACIHNVPEDGFSQEALLTRQEVLRGACKTLTDPDLREDYNQSLIDDEVGTLMVDVPWNKVPGTLCLLQEVGEAEVVLQVGQDLLQKRLGKSFHCDVVLAMALAYVDLSREAMEYSPEAIVQSFEMLEIALKLLQDAGGDSLAPALQAQIDNTLRQIKPCYTLNVLAFPLDENHKLQREEALQDVRHILWTINEDGDLEETPGFSREQCMREAFVHMTANEQVALFSATPCDIPAEGSEIYTAALAHVAEGFVGKKAHLIQEADTLFSQIQLTSTKGLTGDQRLDFTFERGMCALLVGEVDKCQTWLGLDDETSPYRIPAIAEFVFVNFIDIGEADILPGLCKLLEAWLKEVVLPTFRDTAELQMKLGDYYDDPKVLSYLERIEKGGSPLAAAAAIVQLGVEAGSAFDTVKASALETLRKVFPIGKLATSLRAKDSSADAGPTSACILDGRKGYIHYDDQHQATARWDESEKRKASSFAMTKTKSSNKIQNLNWMQVIFTGAAVAMAGWRAFGAPQLKHLTWRSSVTNNATFSGSVEESVKFPRMDASLAGDIVRKWQVAKAQALGSKHSIVQMDEILSGQMLKNWADRVRDVAINGCYWEFNLLDLSIDSVIVSTDGRRATVQATLQEAAFLYGGNNPAATDSYNCTYIMRYEFVYLDDNWKISSGTIFD